MPKIINKAQQEDIKNNGKIIAINFNDTIVVITIPTQQGY